MINLATYEAGMLQAAAYRNLTAFLTEALVDAGITVSEWALLGILASQGATRPSDIASTMDVKTPMATRLVRSLVDKGLAAEAPMSKDQRGKMITMTDAGRQLLDKNESIIRERMRTYMSGVSREDLAGYLRVLEYLAKTRG